MRGTIHLSLILFLPLAAACAAGTSNNIGVGGGGGSTDGRAGTTVVSSSSTSSGSLSGGFGSGSSSSGSSGGGCGLTSSDPSCAACLDASCCNEALACANDATCAGCLSAQTAACDSNAPLAALATCLQNGCYDQCIGGSSSGGGALTCTDTNGGVGCCDAGGVLHYCTQQMTVADQPCSGGQVCGWDAANGWYDCVAPPGGADPTHQYPMACGGGGTSSSSSSSSSSSTSSGGGGVTWTQLYNGIFGPSGTSSCVSNGGCHTFTQSGFKCGTSKTSCYNGMIASGLVTAGTQASSSVLVDPATSPLCGSLGGSMPKGGACVTSTQIQQIKSWLAAGAPNN